jgi:type VI protein secretion system component VasK
MRLTAGILIAMTWWVPAIAGAQATLNKCIDAHGQVTYTNQPCKNAREVHKVEIDPPPLPDSPRVESEKMQDAVPAVSKPATKAARPTIKIEAKTTPKGATEKPVQKSSTKKCDDLSDKLGRVLDQMDLAHRKGYTLEQMNKWNEDVRDLEQQKQQSGCF